MLRRIDSFLVFIYRPVNSEELLSRATLSFVIPEM